MRRPGEQLGRPSPGTVGGRISTVHAQSCSGLPRPGHADLDRDGKAAASSAGASCTPTHRMPAVRRASRAAVSAGEQSPARTSSVTIAHQAVPSDTVRVVSHPCWAAQRRTAAQCLTAAASEGFPTSTNCPCGAVTCTPGLIAAPQGVPTGAAVYEISDGSRQPLPHSAPRRARSRSCAGSAGSRCGPSRILFYSNVTLLTGRSCISSQKAAPLEHPSISLRRRCGAGHRARIHDGGLDRRAFRCGRREPGRGHGTTPTPCRQRGSRCHRYRHRPGSRDGAQPPGCAPRDR